MRLIDADALKSYIDCGHLRPPTETCFSELDVVRMLDKQPTIDAVPVRHGRWGYRAYRNDERITVSGEVVCSNCHAPYFRFVGTWFKYCPHCGAKMDGGAEG